MNGYRSCQEKDQEAEGTIDNEKKDSVIVTLGEYKIALIPVQIELKKRKT